MKIHVIALGLFDIGYLIILLEGRRRDLRMLGSPAT